MSIYVLCVRVCVCDAVLYHLAMTSLLATTLEIVESVPLFGGWGSLTRLYAREDPGLCIYLKSRINTSPYFFVYLRVSERILCLLCFDGLFFCTVRQSFIFFDRSSPFENKIFKW